MAEALRELLAAECENKLQISVAEYPVAKPLHSSALEVVCNGKLVFSTLVRDRDSDIILEVLKNKRKTDVLEVETIAELVRPAIGETSYS